MSQFKYTSYGRTRQPKNVAGAHGTKLANPTAAAPSAATDGYPTENQRFLHVLLENAAAENLTVQVWGYSHAFGAWGQLTDVRNQPAEVTANNTSVHEVIEISGIDRVYFRLSAGTFTDNDDKLFAACSTF